MLSFIVSRPEFNLFCWHINHFSVWQDKLLSHFEPQINGMSNAKLLRNMLEFIPY